MPRSGAGVGTFCLRCIVCFWSTLKQHMGLIQHVSWAASLSRKWVQLFWPLGSTGLELEPKLLCIAAWTGVPTLFGRSGRTLLVSWGPPGPLRPGGGGMEWGWSSYVYATDYQGNRIQSSQDTCNILIHIFCCSWKLITPLQFWVISEPKEKPNWRGLIVHNVYITYQI